MKALIVEDESMVRELLVSVVRENFAFEEILECSDGLEALKLIEENNFGLVITDLIIPKMDGLALARSIHEVSRSVPILAISSECDEYTVRQVNRSGILGFIDKKEVSMGMLFEAIEAVSSGHTYQSKSVRRIINKMLEDSDSYHLILSEREIEILQAIVSGLEKDEIAKRFGITEPTVRRHKHNVMKKLDLPDEASLVRFALDCGMLKNKSGLGWTSE